MLMTGTAACIQLLFISQGREFHCLGFNWFVWTKSGENVFYSRNVTVVLYPSFHQPKHRIPEASVLFIKTGQDNMVCSDISDSLASGCQSKKKQVHRQSQGSLHTETFLGVRVSYYYILKLTDWKTIRLSFQTT